MAKVQGYHIITKVLKDAGVECVFTITGGHVSFLWPEFEDNGIKVYPVSHESMASYAAMGYAQATGKLGVVIATAGPGVTHAITGICDADIYDAPVLYIGGAAPVGQNLDEQLQEYDTLSVLKSCTKSARRCEHVDQIAKYLSVAIRNATGFNPGPAYVEIPSDILAMTEVDEADFEYPTNYTANRRTGASPEVVEEIADAIIAAEKPAILLGEGVQYGATDMTAFKELAEYLKIPTATLLTNKGKFFSEEDPMFRCGFEAGTEADVVLGFNYACDKEFGIWYVNPDAKLISISTDWDDIGLNLSSDIGVVGHSDVIARQILNCVKSKVPEREDRSWADEVWAKAQKEFDEELRPAFESDMTPVHPARFVKEYIDFLNSDEGKDYIFNPCGGDILEWTRVNHRFMMDDAASFPNRMFHGTKFGCIGSQLGELTGVYAAMKKPILHVDGDGSFCENFSEIISYARNGIPVIILLSDNSDYAMIQAKMRMAYPNDERTKIANAITQPDGSGFKYSALAEIVGGYSEEVTKAEDIVPALKRAAATGKPSVINVKTADEIETLSPITKSFAAALGFDDAE